LAADKWLWGKEASFNRWGEGFTLTAKVKVRPEKKKRGLLAGMSVELRQRPKDTQGEGAERGETPCKCKKSGRGGRGLTKSLWGKMEETQ